MNPWLSHILPFLTRAYAGGPYISAPHQTRGFYVASNRLRGGPAANVRFRSKHDPGLLPAAVAVPDERGNHRDVQCDVDDLRTDGSLGGLSGDSQPMRHDLHGTRKAGLATAA